MSQTPVSELGYEQCRDELVEVVRQLEQGGMDLDAALTLWERGEALARRCQEHLDGARARIEAALASADDDLDTGPDHVAPGDRRASQDGGAHP